MDLPADKRNKQTDQTDRHRQTDTDCQADRHTDTDHPDRHRLPSRQTDHPDRHRLPSKQCRQAYR